MIRPPHLNPENARAFEGRDVASSYRFRPRYPVSAIEFLATLASASSPRRVLDLGCGTGFIARPLAPLVDHVDAVDPSEAMLNVGRDEAGGDNPTINWIHGAAETASLEGSYSLIVAGEALHWMDWDIVMPRCASLLRDGGSFAIASTHEQPQPWDHELRDIIARYSVVQNYKPFDLIAALESAGLFASRGTFESEPEVQEQSIDDYIASFHARSSLARGRMGCEVAERFDDDIRSIIPAEPVRRIVSAKVVYGIPLASA